MNKNEEGKVLLSRPKDESLEAFKAWITEMCQHMGIPVEDGTPEAEEIWVKGWKEFWKK